jgi:uncharacterized protein with PQ loop repeat
MIKKSLKYFLIAGINATILTVFLALWADKVERIFNEFVLPLEFLKIIGIAILCLIAMRILVQILRKRKVENTRRRIMLSIILTLAISSYLYVTYSIKVANVLFNPTRQSLVNKIHREPIIPNGAMGSSLTYKEYLILYNMTRFPKIPSNANEISFNYHYDYFLPDYLLELKYRVPETNEIEVKHIDIGYDSSIDQIFTVQNGLKLVTYTEIVR